MRRTLGVVGILLAAACASPSAPSSNPAPRPAFSRLVAAGTPVGAPAASRRFVYLPELDVGRLLKLDTKGHRVAEIPIGDPRGMVEAGCGPFSVHQMPVGSLRGRYCEVPSAVAAFGADVWVPKNDSRQVLRLDDTSGALRATIPVGILPFDIAAGGAGVWVTDYEHSKVVHIDPATNRIAAVIDVARASNVAVTSSDAWVVDHIDGVVVRIDARSNRVVASVPVQVDPLGIAASEDAIWVKNESSNTVSRIDPRQNAVVATIRVSDRLCCDGIDRLGLAGHLLFVGGIDLDILDADSGQVVRRVSHDAVAVAIQDGRPVFTDSAAELFRLN